MKESSSDFRDTLLELIDSAPEPADHPSPEIWLAYQRGELPADEEAHLQEHLVRCRDCFDLAAAAAAFAQADEEPAASQEMETAALWRLLRPQLDPPPGNVREISAGPRRRSRAYFLPSTLAASFFVALVGMTVWNLRQQNALEASRAPRPVPVVIFSGGERSSDSKPAPVTVAECTGPCVLEVHPAELLPVYRLALRDEASSRELWSLELKDPTRTFELPKGIEPGLYSLEVTDPAGGFFEKFSLHVPAPGGRD